MLYSPLPLTLMSHVGLDMGLFKITGKVKLYFGFHSVFIDPIVFDVTLSILQMLTLICIKTEFRSFQFFVNEHTKVFENYSISLTVDRDPKKYIGVQYSVTSL